MAAHKLTPEERVERFWSYVTRLGPNECWPWNGARGDWGHGRFTWNGRLGMAPHFSWILANGPVPDGLCVLHRCDNPPCVNPAHLFLGTQADNMRDRFTKKRHSWGEGHALAVLTDADVRMIRSTTESSASIARRLGVSTVAVWHARVGKTWKHVR